MSFTAFNAPPPKALPKVVKAEPVVVREPKRIPEFEAAFAERPDLFQRLQFLAATDERLILDLSNYIVSLKQQLQASSTQPSDAQHLSKKRRLEDGGAANGSTADWANRSRTAVYTAGDVSFSIPQRKKLRLEWTDAPHGGIRAANVAGEFEFGVSWQDIDQVFALPVPEKAKKQHNFIIFPTGGNGLLPPTQGAPEPIVWMTLEPGPKDTDALQEPEHTVSLLNAQLSRLGKEVILPSSDEFESAIPDVMRKGEPAYHVKAHRGSKDGFLFFLSQGILFAFKKPLLFLPFSSIRSVSYTSVLQRTFNLNISVEFALPGESSKEEEIEFSMLDQADFAGIDGYVKRHHLHDASLAANRKAKVYDVNKPRGPKGSTVTSDSVVTSSGRDNSGRSSEHGEANEMSELQKAEQQLQDEEDEMEEDYVDESEEGGSSEDEDYGEDAIADADESDEEEDENREGEE
ncbi:uncharacterized protein PV09_09022 [Verruconis gallopava]|uniref:Histone chaperone RTT106/FACT complex subunit SPT16-like middle domain-containing protein n=1 Tax=Verruconis gallopava TaxID=253628 RepID=A0A0D1YET9_9PEZI|nr:uncharacterized protein PV09_09022 [Verruconis gallopava]KIV99251.1 hypothetical protein PV09_09022 [Verruconis gallopava]